MENKRIGDYYLDSEIRIAEARTLLKRMILAENVTELKAAFIGFLEITKVALFPLKRHLSTLDGYEKWWTEEEKGLENNKIARFFWDKRNDVVKGGNDLIVWNSSSAKNGGAKITGPLMFYEGQIFRPKNGSNRYIPHEEVSNLKIEWDFAEKPVKKDPISICKEYLETLDGVMESFVKQFPNILII